MASDKIFDFRACIIELLGTFMLVFYGGMCVVNSSVKGVWSETGQDEMMVGIALCHALILTIMIYAGSCSGSCHFNPAVTMIFLLNRQCRVLKVNLAYSSKFGFFEISCFSRIWKNWKFVSFFDLQCYWLLNYTRLLLLWLRRRLDQF